VLRKLCYTEWRFGQIYQYIHLLRGDDFIQLDANDILQGANGHIDELENGTSQGDGPLG
jgi:hypothetical protein